jgi:hypothetical protein
MTTLIQERSSSGRFGSRIDAGTKVEFTTAAGVPDWLVERLLGKFLEQLPEWVAAARRSSATQLELVEVGRKHKWQLDSSRIAHALARVASAGSSQKLAGILPGAAAVKEARVLLEAPETVDWLTLKTADVVIQVAIFGELEYPS